MSRKQSLPLYIYTDGACCGNPGPGGWGAILIACDRDGNEISSVELSGGEDDTTNNRMELMAAISALEILPVSANIVVVTDSRYVQQGIMLWVKKWRINDWQIAKKRDIRNIDLWMRLDAAQSKHNVKWRWVKGHSGHTENERADKLARAGMETYKKARNELNETDRRKMGN